MVDASDSFPRLVLCALRFRSLALGGALLLGACFLPGAASLFAHGEADEELVEHFDEHLDDFAAEVRELAEKADGIVGAFAKGESIEAPLKGWIELWEHVAIHEVIEAKAIHLYPPIWQGVYAMQKVAERAGSVAEMRAAAEKTKAALWQSLGGLRALAKLPGKGVHAAHDHAGHGEPGTAATDRRGMPGELAPDNRIEITGDDDMRFNKTHFVVKVGEPVTLRFKNIGELPAEVMGHNVVVLERGTPLEPFGMAAAEAPGNDYIPTEKKHRDAIVAHTGLLGPDETDTITFTLDEPGEYPFICSFIAHWQIMKGTIEAVADPDDRPVEAILAQLNAAVEAYVEADPKRAEALVHSAYMNIFEGLEGDLIEKDPDLVSQLELDFNAGLPSLFQEAAAGKEVRAQLNRMTERLDRAKTLLAEVEAERGSVF